MRAALRIGLDAAHGGASSEPNLYGSCRKRLNAVIWVRQGKVALAWALSAAQRSSGMTIPSALSIFFTPWMLARPLVWAAIVTMIAVGTLFALPRWRAFTARRMALLGLGYILFAVGLPWAQG